MIVAGLFFRPPNLRKGGDHAPGERETRATSRPPATLEGEISDLAPEQWVEAEGTFILAPSDKGDVPVLKIRKITPVVPPADPFLY